MEAFINKTKLFVYFRTTHDKIEEKNYMVVVVTVVFVQLRAYFNVTHSEGNQMYFERGSMQRLFFFFLKYLQKLFFRSIQTAAAACTLTKHVR